MSAIRLARGFTGRTKVVKFAGCYHGHSDALLVKAGSGAATFGAPDSAGVPGSFTRETLVVPFNDAPAVQNAMDQFGSDIAAVILEPVAGNMGVVPPAEGFLQALRQITERHGALLIFDEVITGFRLGLGGAQELFGVTPDLTCLGKVVGGGLPVGAFGGSREVLRLLAPEGPVYQAGTLAGNPLAMQAGLTTLEEIEKPGFFKNLADAAGQLVSGLRQAARDAGVPVQIQSVGSMFTLFFSGEAVSNFDIANRSDRSRFAAFHQQMLARGIYWPPSQLEACFVSAAHGPGEIEITVARACEVFRSLT
jgi:glutamate-1-semialdehyde 2,1-aminomutase